MRCFILFLCLTFNLSSFALCTPEALCIKVTPSQDRIDLNKDQLKRTQGRLAYLELDIQLDHSLTCTPAKAKSLNEVALQYLYSEFLIRTEKDKIPAQYAEIFTPLIELFQTLRCHFELRQQLKPLFDRQTSDEAVHKENKVILNKFYLLYFNSRNEIIERHLTRVSFDTYNKDVMKRLKEELLPYIGLTRGSLIRLCQFPLDFKI